MHGKERLYMGRGYIPRKDLTDPVDFAGTHAVKYDRYIYDKIAEFHVEEARLLSKIKSNEHFKKHKYGKRRY